LKTFEDIFNVLKIMTNDKFKSLIQLIKELKSSIKEI